jgi:hypothetical protein
MFSQAGIFLGTRRGFRADFLRLGKVASRITCGLFFHEMNRRLPDPYVARAFIKEGFEEAAFVEGLSMLAKLIGYREPKTVGTVFKYWFGFPVAREDPNLSFWLLLFYDQVLFVCATLKRDEAEALDRRQQIASYVL